MKTRIAILAGIVAVTAWAVAQNLPTVVIATKVSTSATAPVYSNAVLVVTTNITGATRAYIEVANTNAAGTVLVFNGTNTASVRAAVTAGTTWKEAFPIVDTGSYSVRSTADALPVIVNEGFSK